MKKSVLITGAGSGIGAATAREFSRRGYFVFLLGRNRSHLEEVSRNLSASELLICDLRDPAQIQKVVTQVLQHPEGKNLEVLVNNAGIFKTHTTLEGSDELWLDQLNVNLMGPVRMTRALWPHFEKQGRGSILNVSSTLGLKPSANTSAYSASKAALLNWTQALAQEGGPKGIRVNSVSPGFVDTPIHTFHVLQGEEKEKTLAGLGPLQPLGRIGAPEEIAKAVAFLATDDSPWTTGANLNVDGGIHLA
ncbi:MAG TPA: SDR family oxidoreductase [Pseudobdellovibrionaceae bacterium]|nr:SDR family oxidoreductase [Pseudobdellovibrionaceae bacterium]